MIFYTSAAKNRIFHDQQFLLFMCISIFVLRLRVYTGGHLNLMEISIKLYMNFEVSTKCRICTFQ